MDAWLATLPEWVWTMIAVVGALLTALVRRRKVRLEAAAQGLPMPIRGKSCQTCLHWNLDEGKRAIAQNPAFAQAALVLAPNAMMMTAEDGDGESNKDRQSLPVFENKWEYIGACMGFEEMRHRTDKCPHYRSAAIGRVQGAQPGDGFPVHVREEMRAGSKTPDLEGHLD